MKKICALLLCVFLSACLGGRSQPSRFYSVDILPITSVNKRFTQSVAVVSVQLPKHLDRPQMVRSDLKDSQTIISEKNRWVEPLSNVMERVLTADLAEVLPKAVVKQKTSVNEKFDFYLGVNILELKTIFDDKMTLTGWWNLTDAQGQIVRREKVIISVAVADDYSSMAHSLSELVAVFAQKIAQKI